MTQIFANNAQSTVASMVGPGDTTIQVASGEGALFPSPGGGDYFRVTLTQAGAESSWEILTCTARSGDVLTVTRAQEGTSAATWAVGSKVELRLTAGVLWPLDSSVSGNLPVANLTTVNADVGSFGSSTAVPNFTVNEKGLVTAAGTSAVVAPASTLTGSTLASNVVTSSLTSVGTLGSLAVTGTATAGTFSGPLTGNVTGNVSGSSGSTTGNAATATALQTARTINGVPFDGTGNITVTAAAGSLTGTTLANNVVTSSLTSVGTIGTGVWQGTGIAAGFGGTGYTTFADGDLLVGLSGAVLAKLAVGSENQVLRVTSGLPAWGGAPSSALNSTQIGYGSGSNVLTGSSTFTWTNSSLTMQLGAGTGISTIRTANASSGANAASLTIQTGDANSGVVGAGLLTLQGGAGAGSSAAGNIAITAGNNPSTGAGGSVSITAGTSSSGTAGNVTIVTGGTTRVTVASTGAVTFQSSISATSGTFSSTLESTSLRVTGSTAPDNGFYLQATGVVGLAANNTAAYLYGSNAFASQTDNSRDLGVASTNRWRNLYIVNSPTVGSDLRGKVDVADCDLGLDFVLALRPISYRLLEGRVDVRAEVVGKGVNEAGEEFDLYKTVETPVPGERTHRGFGSQEVRAVLDKFGLDGKTFAGWCLADPSDPDSMQALRYEQFIAPLVKAVQELAAEVRELRSAGR